MTQHNKYHNFFHRLWIKIKWIIKQEGELKGNHHKEAEAVILIIRNVCVLAAAVLFILGMTHIPHRYLLKAIAYVLGAGAYFCELLILNDCFSIKPPIKEKFMIYCFGPLYLLMAISYFVEHLDQ